MLKQQEVGLRDFYQSVVLFTLGYPLLRLERNQGDIATFIFGDPNLDLEHALENYWNGKIMVNAKEMVANIHELKTRLHTKI